MKKNPAFPLLLPGLAGVCCLYLLPLGMTLCRSLDQGSGYGLGNYAGTVNNPVFRLGAGNLLLLALIAIPAAAALSLGLALLLRRAGRGAGWLLLPLLLPCAVPSGSTAFFWNSVFGLNGVLNRLLYQSGREIVLWDAGRWSILIPAVLYLWKFCGLFALLLLAGLENIPARYYEIARLEGAGELRILAQIVLPGSGGTAAVLAACTFAEVWNTTDQAVVFLREGYRMPLSVPLSDLLRGDPGVLPAGSVIYLLPACLAFLLCLARLRRRREV